MLRIENLSKEFDGKVVIQNLNYEIEDGAIVTIVGESGGGKTTLLRILSGLEEKTSGKIWIDDIEIDPFHSKGDEMKMGVVFQDFQLFPHLSVLQNITLAQELVLKLNRVDAEKSAKSLLDQLGLFEMEKKYPYQLSGGQKQRVALARALAMQPKILGYDEPTSALDPGLTKQVEEMILDLKKTGVTQIVVTHDIEFAKNISDKMLKVEDFR
jgi:polar amino acid transport system ATP-binding protein